MQISLSLEEARAACGLGKTRLYEAINNGDLPARKFGKRTLILKSDLEAFLTSLPAYRPIKTAEE